MIKLNIISKCNNFVIILFLFSSYNLRANGSGKGNAKSNQSKINTSNEVKIPDSKWLGYKFANEKDTKQLDSSKQAPDRVRVKFEYDTLGNGVKTYQIGYLYKKSNTFEADSEATFSANNPSVKNVVKPTVTKSQITAYAKEVKLKSSSMANVSGSFRINHSYVPSQTVSDNLIDYINNYNANYGKRIRALKTTKHKTFSTIESILKKRGVPSQLKYLAVIESSLNQYAVSKVGAVGLWQFMDFTANDMNLVVNGSIDERTNINKSTEAATKFLKQLYNITDDWLLVVAAYNCGPGPVLRAIKKTGSKNFWVIKKHLPRETQGHVMAFLATAAIMENLSSFHGLFKESKLPKIDLKENEHEAKIEDESKKRIIKPEEKGMLIGLPIKGTYSKAIIVKRLSLKESDFNRWNPHFEEEMAKVNASYNLYIPKDRFDGFLEMKTEILNESKDYIHNHNSLSKEEILNDNGNQVRVDNTLTYIIQYGETLDLIAKRFGTTPESLIELNKKDDGEILPGDIIRIK